MVSVIITKHFRLACKADCSKRIEQELKNMQIFPQGVRYFEAKSDGNIYAIFRCSCREKTFDEMLKKLENDSEEITVYI